MSARAQLSTSAGRSTTLYRQQQIAAEPAGVPVGAERARRCAGATDVAVDGGFIRGGGERSDLACRQSVEDVAGAALYLASANADFVNGTILTVDAGYTAR